MMNAVRTAIKNTRREPSLVPGQTMRPSFKERFKSQLRWIAIPVACAILYRDRNEEFDLALRFARPIVTSLLLCLFAAMLDLSVDHVRRNQGK